MKDREHKCRTTILQNSFFPEHLFLQKASKECFRIHKAYLGAYFRIQQLLYKKTSFPIKQIHIQSSDKNSRKWCEMYSDLTIKTPE